MDPGEVLGPGFQLSFGAVAGILAWVPRGTRLIPPDLPRILTWLLGSLLTSAAAILGTLPATALWFQEVAPWGLVANLWAIPLVGAVVVPGALGALLLPGSAGLFALALADGVLGLTLDSLQVLPAELWHPALSPLGALALGLVVLLLPRQELSAAFAILVVFGLRVVPTGLELTFLDVGQGDATLVRSPGGGAWLVDGGPRDADVMRFLRREGVRELDAVVLSHPHADHMRGLQAVVEELEVTELWLPRPPLASETAYLALWQAAFRRGLDIRMPEDLGWRMSSDGSSWQAVHPLGDWEASGRDHVNEGSLVLVLRHGERSVLFTGDIEEDAEAHLLDQLPRVEVVKVAHHGSRSSSAAELVSRVDASLAVISVGRRNRFGHPSSETLANWMGRRVIRTDRDGSVRLRGGPQGWSAARWRAPGRWLPFWRSPWRPCSPGSRGDDGLVAQMDR